MATPKTLEDLAKDLRLTADEYNRFRSIINDTPSTGRTLQKYLKDLKETGRTHEEILTLTEFMTKELEKGLELQERTARSREELARHSAIYISQLDVIERFEKEITKETEARAKHLKDGVSKALSTILKQNEEIFKISHQMQLQGNLTWREYTKSFDEAYAAARRMNAETSKQLHTVKDIVEVQNALLKDGWRNVDMSTLTDVAASIRMISTTLGIDFPQELSTALQLSYRQFGSETDKFITALGNRLNTFSDTFGVSVGMLTGVVSQMASSTSFIARNNMQTQVAINESLMKAAALSARVGLTSTDYLTTLALTSQFGTADEVAGLFEGGALLQGFDTRAFQEMMIGGQADAAISSLFTSIHDTMAGLQDNHYLRNEYMKMIGQSFGLSQSDLLNISTFGGDLSQYEDDIQERLLNVNTSMVDEIKDLKVSLVDTLTNWWSNTNVSQGISKVFQEMGLVGADKHFTTIIGQLYGILAILGLSGGAANLRGGITKALGHNVGKTTLGGALGAGVVGIGGSMLSQQMGRSIQTNQNIDTNTANILGGGVSVLGSAASGAAAGAMLGGGIHGAIIGGAIGAISGLISSFDAAGQRDSAMREIEDNRRTANRRTAQVSTGDPLLDAINHQTKVLNESILGTAEKTARAMGESNLQAQVTNKNRLFSPSLVIEEGSTT